MTSQPTLFNQRPPPAPAQPREPPQRCAGCGDYWPTVFVGARGYCVRCDEKTVFGDRLPKKRA